MKTKDEKRKRNEWGFEKWRQSYIDGACFCMRLSSAAMESTIEMINDGRLANILKDKKDEP